MTINRISILKYILTIFVFQVAIHLFSQYSPDSIIHFEVKGNDTDPLIFLDGQKKNQVLLNPTSESKNTLLLHLVGTLDNPNSTILYPTEAAHNGFHCINLMYRNWTSAQSACAANTDLNCYLDFRREIIEGFDYSSEINVNASNSINNRLIKLLIYLDTNFPAQNWSQFYSGNTILWNKIIVSGHSQGGGHAAVIGMTKPIQRVLMFGSPNDYIDTLNIPAPWTSQPHIVADSNYFGFNALFDEIVDFWKQYEQWEALGLNSFGDTIDVDATLAPHSNTRQLYTQRMVSSPNPLYLTHDIMIRDAETPTDNLGAPVFGCTWKYMIGIPCNVASINDKEKFGKITLFPNPTFGKVFIESELNSIADFEITVFDVYGRRMTDYPLTISSNELINFKAFPDGIYLVQILDGSKVITSQRIIKITE